MKKRNVLIAGVAGFILLGGAIGVGALTDSTQGSGNNLMTVKKAEEKALNEVKGIIESVELENDNGQLKYEVEVQDLNGHDDIDIDIDAKSGEVIKVDQGDDKNESKDAPISIKKNDLTKKLTKNEAIAIATKETPGKVVDADYDDGEYEIEIHTATHEVEYEIDARTGQILEKDMEKFDDDDDRYDD
ncbi:putative membrane protein YkoI [Cytobacillus eiseniae]|uniref:Membrane protein YkoI n=1 Tax=Cytobacillus eiseniae TaxID=762947 RepID=A0ABS4RGC7_9BACI|nr:PepSY domain-containing protein [Cytobacillus eiseniae]MBP2241774.1 putative membrane protein YkoI [Cytobacillus eiseniae]